MRRFLVLLVVLGFAAPAEAAPRPLAKLQMLEGFALAGDHVLYTRVGDEAVRVNSVPVGGGPARTVATLPMAEGRRVIAVTLSASPQRAAAVLHFADSYDAINGSQLFAGAPDGGWSALTAAATLFA